MNYDKHSPIEDSRLLQHIAQVDVGIQEVRIQSHSFFEVMNRQPDLALCVKYTSKVAPCNGEVRTCFNSF